MKNVCCSVLLLSAAVLSACDSHDSAPANATPNDPAPVQATAPVAPVAPTFTPATVDDVKYPAVLVYEGGTGRFFGDKDGSKHHALWRLSICLPETYGKTKKGSVDLTAEQLGQPILTEEIRSQDGTNAGSKHVLSSVTIEYEYSNMLVSRDGYAYGEADIEAKPQLSWQLVDSANRVLNPGPNYFFPEFDGFGLHYTTGYLVGMSESSIPNDQDHTKDQYVTHWLDRATYNKDTNELYFNAACEHARNKPYVLQTGDELKN